MTQEAKPVPCRLCGSEPSQLYGGMQCSNRACHLGGEWFPPATWNAINAPHPDQERMSYVEEREIQMVHNILITAGAPPPSDLYPIRFMYISSDGAEHWGSTYREAVDRAMLHDDWKGTL